MLLSPPLLRCPLSPVARVLTLASNLDRILQEVAASTGLELRAPEPASEMTPRTVEVQCKGVFRACCLLAEDSLSDDRLVVQRIAMFGHDEEAGPWKRSRYGVFRRVTEQAEMALMHFRCNYRSTALQRLLVSLFCRLCIALALAAHSLFGR